MTDYIVFFDKLSLSDLPRVGGKNASLGELISNLSSSGVKVPKGFATTTKAFKDYLELTGLDKKIKKELANLDTDNIEQLQSTGKSIRNWISNTPLHPELEQAIRQSYDYLSSILSSDFSVAVRSSATAEDLPDASFAGQQETFLNVKGVENVLAKTREVFASLYNDRAISYRVHNNFAHEDVAISVGVQQMIRSDIASSGVMFTLDTESGFADVVFITGSYGLGEMVVQGAVNPDEFYAYKPNISKGIYSILRKNIGEKAVKMTYDEGSNDDNAVKIIETPEAERNQFCLSNEDVRILAELAMKIEKHYNKHMDIEWAKDGLTGEIYIVQARPETVKSKAKKNIERYRIIKSDADKVLVEGSSIGQKIGAGKVRIINSISEMNQVEDGDILVTDITDPDWEPVMKRTSAIVTNRGGRTCHAAIIARELGIPAIVGTKNGTKKLLGVDTATVSCCEGDTGYVYKGKLQFSVEKIKIDKIPEIPVKIMMNVGNPNQAFGFSQIPNNGIGLARLEFIINRLIGIHPSALLNYSVQSEATKKKIDDKIQGYELENFYVEKLAEGISTIAAAFYPKPVIVRLSDFKSNEYFNLVGGDIYEPQEENPMLGFRGAVRYVSDKFKECFELECKALRLVREKMQLHNVWIMVPFVRTLDEAKNVVELLKQNGIEKGKHGLKLIMMCEIPSNAILAKEFLQYFDGFSIGSNDLTQLTLGLDRDSELVAQCFNEQDLAVKALLKQAILACKEEGKYIGICGQGPSDYPELAQWLMEQGIESMSLNPDTVLETWQLIAKQCTKK